ncbi:MAG: hypothetical protein HKN04_14340 [Rhodothermaceae bacterium]|nr:hypothetical protein [Rhodothermaceae bacterium]
MTHFCVVIPPIDLLLVTEVPSRIPSGPPLPSRAVLLIGGLALLCLVLLATLTFAVSNADAPSLALDAPPDPVAAARLDATTTRSPQRTEAGSDAVYAAEPNAIPTGVLTALEQASEEPIEVEFNRLLDAIQHGFGESSVQIEPTLRPYAARIAGRLNVRPVSFTVRVAAPDRALAQARARALGRLFDAMGVVSSRLSFTPRAGAPGLSAELA